MTTSTALGQFEGIPVTRDVRADLIDVISRTILAHPRSQQKRIGPSEIGTPCTRKLGYKLAGVEAVRPPSPAWRPTVGTAVHTWLQVAFEAENRALGWDRWVTEAKVAPGTIGGTIITGHCDLFDLLTGTVIDWKIPGPSSIKAKKSAKSPGETYRVQAHAYGLGFANAKGYEVRHVGIMFLPSAGELSDHYYWTEPFDPLLAIEAFERADAVANTIKVMGSDAIEYLPAVNDYCSNCEWWSPGSTDARVGCPGVLPLPVTSRPGSVFGR
jgi:hypothetical protein